MWCRSINHLLIILLFCAGAVPVQAQEPVAKYVVLITIDGMRPEMVSDPTMPSPTIKQIAADGIFVPRMTSVAPSSTYPNHTSLVTGARPARHGIYYNSPFMGNAPTYWYADSIRTQTIWGAAKEHGLTTASLFWPVSTHSPAIDVNVPEYWTNEHGVDNLQFLRPHSSPAGIIDSLQKYATGYLTSRSFNARTRNREGRTAYMATYIFEQYRPHLTTIHFISTDSYQHATGTKSNETKMAVAAVDYGVNQVIEGLARAGMLDSTAVIVCGDHGFVNTTKVISPNVWLAQAGLMSPDDPADWRAKFHGAGVTMFLYLNNPSDGEAVALVRRKLASLPEATRALFRIVERDELEALGCDPRVELAVEPVVGVSVATNASGADVTERFGGKHGYLLPHDPTTLVASGPGVPQGVTVSPISVTDVAPFVMHLLGIDFEAPDGKLNPEMVLP